MPTTKHELSRMTWKEAEEAFAQNKVFLLPLGSMEEHGPHSVTGDYRAAEEAAKEIAKRTDSVMVPVIPFGYPNARTRSLNIRHLQAAVPE